MLTIAARVLGFQVIVSGCVWIYITAREGVAPAHSPDITVVLNRTVSGIIIFLNFIYFYHGHTIEKWCHNLISVLV